MSRQRVDCAGAATPALVVVDLQNGFISADSAHVVPVIADLAARWLAAGRLVIFTRYANYPGSPYERLVGWRAMHGPPDTDMVAEVAELVGHPGAVLLDKATYSALAGEGLALIRGHGITDLYICGIATDGCVLATALAAFDAGFVPWVLTDAIASNATSHPPAEVHAAGLLVMSRSIGAGQMITAPAAVATLGTSVRR